MGQGTQLAEGGMFQEKGNVSVFLSAQQLVTLLTKEIESGVYSAEDLNKFWTAIALIEANKEDLLYCNKIAVGLYNYIAASFRTESYGQFEPLERYQAEAAELLRIVMAAIQECYGNDAGEEQKAVVLAQGEPHPTEQTLLEILGAHGILMGPAKFQMHLHGDREPPFISPFVEFQDDSSRESQRLSRRFFSLSTKSLSPITAGFTTVDELLRLLLAEVDSGASRNEDNILIFQVSTLIDDHRNDIPYCHKVVLGLYNLLTSRCAEPEYGQFSCTSYVDIDKLVDVINAARLECYDTDKEGQLVIEDRDEVNASDQAFFETIGAHGPIIHPSQLVPKPAAESFREPAMLTPLPILAKEIPQIFLLKPEDLIPKHSPSLRGS